MFRVFLLFREAEVQLWRTSWHPCTNLIIWSIQEDKVSFLMWPNTSLTCVNGRRKQKSVITTSTIMVHPPKSFDLLLCWYHQHREPCAEAHWELLDVANKEGSGSPRVILLALICIDFKRSGKQSWPDFEAEADEYLRVFGLFCELG